MLELGIVCVVSLAGWVYLVAGHGGFWRTGHRLPAVAAEPARGAWPDVVAVVPARNEAGILPETLPKLLAQEYPGRFRVILVDDGSDDGTGSLAGELGAKAERDGGASLTVLAGGPRPDGWAGKVWAMSQGLAALEADDSDNSNKSQDGGHGGGGYVLFTDADISWGQGALRRLVAAAEGDDRQLVSQMVLLRACAAWERHIVPAFVYFFAQLYPFRRASDPRSKTAAGAGGCQLVRHDALVRAGGLEPVKGALIDDVALATLLKRDRNRIWLGLSTEITSARPYPGLAGLWQMIARSAYHQLRYNPLLLVATITGLLLLYAAPPAGALAGLIAVIAGTAGPGAALAGFAGLAAWALMAASYVPMLRLYRLSPLRAPSLPLIAMLYAAMTVDSARRHYSGRTVAWRGRRLPGPSPGSRDDRVTLTIMRVPEMKLWAGEPDDGDELRRGFLIADVFTGRPLEGNQLGVFPDGRGLSDELMLKATRELKFSETVFFLPPSGPAPSGPAPSGPATPGPAHADQRPGGQPPADAHVRIFTPAAEIPFAGHPTLGSAWVLGSILGTGTVTIQTGAGIVPVELERDSRNEITFGRMAQPIPVIEALDDSAALLDALGVTGKTGSAPIEVYVNGPRNVYVEIQDEETLAAMAPDMRKLGRIPLNASCFARAAEPKDGWVTRMFAPALGVAEDPATGSAAGPLAVHLARHGRIAFGEEIEIRQGAQVNRPSFLYARADGTPDRIEKVSVGGRTVIVAHGEYRLG